MKIKELILILMESPLCWLMLVEERLELIQSLMERQPSLPKGESVKTGDL